MILDVLEIIFFFIFIHERISTTCNLEVSHECVEIISSTNVG